MREADGCVAIRVAGRDETARAPTHTQSGQSVPGFVDKELIRRGGGGGLGGSHKGAAYSKLLFPQPNFGSRNFLGRVGLRPKRPPPLL